jgi:hypothetical protein
MIVAIVLAHMSSIVRIGGIVLASVVAVSSVTACDTDSMSKPKVRKGDRTEQAPGQTDEEEATESPTRAPTASDRGSAPATAPAPAASAAPAPPAPPAAPAMKDKLDASQKLAPGEKLVSPNGLATAVYQEDGNFVVYGPGGPLFHTRTDGTAVGEVIMQEDGNLVLYSNGTPLFDSATHGNPGASVIMQDDCNLVVYGPGGVALWSSQTQCN